MSKRKKNGLLLLIYTVMILLCFGVVAVVDVLHSPDHSKEQTSDASTVETPGGLPEAEEEETGDQTNLATPAQAEETIPEIQYRNASSKKQDQTPILETEEPKEEYKLPSIVVASDVHYYSPDLTDYGQAFWTMAEGDDGKVVNYIPELMDAFTEEMEKQKPSAVILSGDLTLNGEKAGHEALAEKLRIMEEKGVKVLVIPGNHDINNYNSASYMGEDREPSDIVTPQEFYDIYHTFGYDQARNRDEDSLSYVYELDDKNWLLMLDSAQYEPVNKVGGRIKEETLVWMKDRLEEAKALGVTVVTVAHHNLLKESSRYPVDCTLENSQEVVELLEAYRVPLYISGHLHLQRTKTYKPRPGKGEEGYHISEVVADSFAISPFQYGTLKWTEDSRLVYTTQTLDVAHWSQEKESPDENLLTFSDYGASFLTNVVSTQIYGQLKNLPEEQRQEMAQLYGDINRAYCAGIPIDAQDVRTSKAYRLWERNLPDSKLFDEINEILRDTRHDFNSWECALENGRRNDSNGNDNGTQP